MGKVENILGRSKCVGEHRVLWQRISESMMDQYLIQFTRIRTQNV
jgi:hypothetical protein